MSEQNIAVTVDCVVFCLHKERVKVLLVQRGNDPFKDQWALPGGFLEADETLEEGAKRELEEETGVQIGDISQVRAFGAPGRDPRGRTISIAFWATIPSEIAPTGADDAADARWFDVQELPHLAFDHDLILREALIMFKKNN